MQKQQEVKVLLTKEGLLKLKEEYRELTDKKRLEVAEKMQDALGMGDLSENAMYSAAKEEQAFVEGRIAELEGIFHQAEVYEPSHEAGIVDIGSKVGVKVAQQDHTFWIVGAHEANPLEHKISHESPIGQALIGKRVGDTVSVQAPIGTVEYSITAIE